MGKSSVTSQRRCLALFLIFIMAIGLVPVERVKASGTLITTGNYYFSVVADDSGAPDKGATGLISFENGLLTDGKLNTYAGWRGKADSIGTVNIVIDLLKDYPLDNINLVLNSVNSYWTFRNLTVKYRSEADSDFYYIAAEHTRTGTDLNYSVNVPMSNKVARFVMISITRTQPYTHIPLSEVQIYKGVGEEGQNPGPALTAAQMADETKKYSLQEGKRPLVTTGNYYFSVVADDSGAPDKGTSGLISFENGLLTDGKLNTYAGWRGKAGSIGTVNIVIDLLKDYPLDEINLVLNSPNSYWSFKELMVKYRPEAVADYYYIATKHIKTGTSLNYSVNVPMSNKVARFIVISIKRSHAYQNLPLTEVQIHKGIGEEGQNPGPALTVEQMAVEARKDALMVDKYGQWVYETWPGKVTSDEQLQKEYAEEAARLAGVAIDATKYDPYGGIKKGGQYEATGFFRVEKIDDRWWFVTPEGYKFFLKGVDAASILEWGYGTPLKKDDGTPKRVFEELPDPITYASAYVNDSNGERVSFVIANVMRKYGENYKEKWEDITKKRMTDWGFNAFSKWTKPENVVYPYMRVLQDPSNLKRIQWTYDVFDPQSESIIEAALSGQLESAKNDPWLIGYTYDNEAGWNPDIVKEVLTYNSSSPAKCAFVDFIAPRYNNDIAAVNQLLGTSCVSFEELKDTSINSAKVPAIDVSEYIQLASRTYFSTVRNIIRKYDTNHLFMGASIVPTWRTCLDWDAAAMDYVDVFSVDDYTDDASWISRYEPYGKPLVNLEYTFSVTAFGLSPINASTNSASVEQRGVKYKSFVEAQATSPLFIGSGWFAYYDQAVPGRKDGENYSIGLLNQQDQPYTEMTDIMRTVNAGLENVHQGGLYKPIVSVNSNWTNAASVPVTMMEGDGTNRIEYSMSGATVTDWTYYTGALDIVNEGKTFITTRTVSASDSVSNAVYAEVYIDRTAPSVPMIVANTDWTNAAKVPVSITAGTDEASGVNRTEYSLAGATAADWSTYTTDFEITKEGQTTISARTVDNTGNVSEIVTKTVKINRYVEEDVEIPASAPGPRAIPVPPAPIVKGGNIELPMPKVDSTGTAVAEVPQGSLENAIKAVKNSDTKVIEIKVPINEKISSIMVRMPVQTFNMAQTSQIERISIDTGIATVQIAPGAFGSKIKSTSTHIELSVSVVDKSKLPPVTADKVAENTVYDFNAYIDGEKISQFDGKKAVRISVDCKLKPGENADKIVAYYINDNGGLEVVKNCKYDAVTEKITFTTDHFSKYVVKESNVSFHDVTDANWAKEYIEALAGREIVNGIGDNRFNPDGKITREEFVKMILSALDLIDESAVTDFKDVEAGTWYYESVASAQKLSIINGYSDGAFGIGREITRQEMAAIAYRASRLARVNLTKNVKAVEFSDSLEINEYAKEAVTAMQEAGILQGRGNNKYEPFSNSTRAEAAKIIYSLFKAME